jgi:hypothetical protein
MKQPSFNNLRTALRSSVLAWPAWLRVMAITPLLFLLWLGVWWASLEAAPI